MSEAIRSMGADHLARYLHRMKEREMEHSTSGGGGGTYDPMEARIAKLEETRIETAAILSRIEQRLDNMDRHLATKADFESLRGEMKGLSGKLDGKLGAWQFLTVMGGAVTLILAWPSLARIFSL